MKIKKIFNFILIISLFITTMNINLYASTVPACWDSSNELGIYSNNNLTVKLNGLKSARANKGKTSGKWYWEITYNEGSDICIGVGNAKANLNMYPGNSNGNSLCYSYVGEKIAYPQIREKYGKSFSIGDVIGVALDMNQGSLGFYVNGEYQGIAFNNLSSMGELYPMVGEGASAGYCISTVNFGASTFKYDIPAGYIAYDTFIPNNSILDIEADSYTINGGSQFDTFVIIDNISDIYAEDFTVNYDNTLFEFISGTVVGIDELEIYHNNITNNDLRYIVASKGVDNGLNNKKQIVKLTFKAKNIDGIGDIIIKSGLIANGQGIETIPTLSGKKFTVIKQNLGDVNLDGKYTLGDLAIASRLLATTSTSWENFKPDTDSNGTVENIDLKNIVSSILNNE